jgi:hypothetical protein
VAGVVRGAFPCAERFHALAHAAVDHFPLRRAGEAREHDASLAGGEQAQTVQVAGDARRSADEYVGIAVTTFDGDTSSATPASPTACIAAPATPHSARSATGWRVGAVHGVPITAQDSCR